MKITGKSTEIASALILGIFVTMIGNVTQSAIASEHHGSHSDVEYEGHGDHEYTDEIEITMYFPRPAEYYGQAVISVNDVEKKLDVQEEIAKHGNPFAIDYYFEGYKPDESVVCLKNSDSGTIGCREFYDEEEITIQMPD
jgi:hypothetical protein